VSKRINHPSSNQFSKSKSSNSYHKHMSGIFKPGFVIAFELGDEGDRRNDWCKDRYFWASQGITLQHNNPGADPATIHVGDSIRIQPQILPVGLQGAVGEFRVLSRIDQIRAWVCYTSTVPPDSGIKITLPSIDDMNPPSLVTPPQVSPYFVSSLLDNPPVPRPVVPSEWNLSPNWFPTASDLVPPNREVHCCVLANTYGISYFGSALPGTVGDNTLLMPADFGKFSICTSNTQAQRNITLLSVFHRIGGLRTPVEFGFVSGSSNDSSVDRTQFTVEISVVEQHDSVEPIIRGVIESSALKDIPFKPSKQPLKSLNLKKNSYQCPERLAKILCQPDEIVDDVAKNVAGLIDSESGSGTKLHVTLPPQGDFVALLLQAEIDTDEEVGSVHVFDIVQTDKHTGKRGGHRVGIIVAGRSDQ
jgi:hypothetical protein